MRQSNNQTKPTIMSSKKIYKYEILADEVTLEMPKEAVILAAKMQGQIPCFWALVNPENEKETRRFEMIPTGYTMDAGVKRKYIDTLLMHKETLVFHLFELLH